MQEDSKKHITPTDANNVLAAVSYRQLILIKMELKKMTLEEIEKEAFVYIGNADENADIIPDGKIDEAANLMANFIHHLWEIDVVYEPSV